MYIYKLTDCWSDPKEFWSLVGISMKMRLSHFNDCFDNSWKYPRSQGSDIFSETQKTSWKSEGYHFSWSLEKESLIQLFPRILVNRIVDPIPNEFWSLVGILMKMRLSHFNDCWDKSWNYPRSGSSDIFLVTRITSWNSGG